MTDDGHTTAPIVNTPAKSSIQLFKTNSSSLEDDKLVYIHHMLCNLTSLSYSLHANQAIRFCCSKLLQKKLMNFRLRFLTVPSLTSTLTSGLVAFTLRELV